MFAIGPGQAYMTLIMTFDLDDNLGSWAQFQKLIHTTSFRMNQIINTLIFKNPTAAGFKEAFDRTSATLNDLDHDIWPWRWPWIINIISEMDSGGQNHIEKMYYLTF